MKNADETSSEKDEKIQQQEKAVERIAYVVFGLACDEFGKLKPSLRDSNTAEIANQFIDVYRKVEELAASMERDWREESGLFLMWGDSDTAHVVCSALYCALGLCDREDMHPFSHIAASYVAVGRALIAMTLMREVAEVLDENDEEETLFLRCEDVFGRAQETHP